MEERVEKVNLLIAGLDLFLLLTKADNLLSFKLLLVQFLGNAIGPVFFDLLDDAVLVLFGWRLPALLLLRLLPLLRCVHILVISYKVLALLDHFACCILLLDFVVQLCIVEMVELLLEGRLAKSRLSRHVARDTRTLCVGRGKAGGTLRDSSNLLLEFGLLQLLFNVGCDVLLLEILTGFNLMF